MPNSPATRPPSPGTGLHCGAGYSDVIDIIGQGHGAIGGPMEPPPEGLWGMPAEMLKALPGYGADVAQRRAEARQIMETHGYGPGKRLAVTVAARNVAAWRDPTLILLDELNEI